MFYRLDGDFMSRQFAILLLLLLVSTVYIGAATSRAIFDDGDALYSHIAKQMAMTGDWVTPYANGVRFLDKPPVLFWVAAVSYHLFGYNEFAARFPAALAVVGIGLILFFLAKKAGGTSAGFIAGTSSALCIGTFLFTRQVFPDVFFVFFLTLSIAAFLRWYQDEKNPVFPALVFYAAIACAVLTKGLMGIAFPIAILVLFLLWCGDFRRLWRFHIGKGTLLFVILAFPWHILAAYRNKGFLWYFFVNEQFLRFIGKRQPYDYESISLPIFWALVLVWLFPWSSFLPAIRHVWRNSNPQTPDARYTIRICTCWALVILVFFSLSSRIEHYSMPIFPPLALLIGVVLSPQSPWEATSRRSVARGFAFLGILGGLVALLAIVGGLWMGLWSSGQSLSEAATVRLHAYKFYFAPLFEMPPDVLDRLKTPLAGTCCVFAIGFIGAWWLNHRGRRLSAVIVLSLVMAGFCFFAFQSIGICEDILSSRQFGRKLNQLYRPGDTAVVLGDFETANSINFYCPMILHVYKGSAALLQWGMRYPGAPKLLFSQALFEKQWQGSQRTFLLSPEDQVSSLGLKAAYTILRSGGRVLLCNQKAD
jgi:4-amino-4-deoxy-L-arabinose transferase-like glycosyltransferase